MRSLIVAALAAATFSGCAAHDHRSDREQRDEWRREAEARPPPCSGAAWVDGREYPDGRWEPGRWTCGYNEPGYGANPNGYPAPGYGGSGRDDRGDHDGHR
jgi:hypothetical protein